MPAAARRTADVLPAYRMALGTAGKKAPTTLTISASMYVSGGGEQVLAMNFVRYSK